MLSVSLLRYVAAGLMGVTCGMLLSRYLRPKYQWMWVNN